MKKILIYDQAEQSPVGMSWRVGARAFGHKFDHIIAAMSWEYATEIIQDMANGSIDEIHYWGHGRQAAVLLGGRVLPTRTLIAWEPKLKLHSLVWLRVCSAFHGLDGQRYARYTADHLQADVASYTYKIGALQSGLHVQKPGEEATWDEHEGGTGSRIWAPNTISALRQHVPAWCY